MTRREAFRNLAAFVAASPLVRADRKYSAGTTPVQGPANVFDFAKLAKAKLDPLAWDYLAEGSEDETSERDSRAAFEKLIIRPHFLMHDVSKVDITTTVLGQKLQHPIFLCPTGGKNCFFPNGEVETAYGAGLANTMMITRGFTGKIAAKDAPKNWWMFSTGQAVRKDFGQRLEDEGCSGISVTVDIYHVSHRERSIHNGLSRSWCEMGGIPRNGTELAYKPDDVIWTAGDYPKPLRAPTPSWDDLKRLRDSVKLPVIVKGIMTSEDTTKAVQAGMSGIIVSNHGGRQLDAVGGTMEALPECLEAAGGKMPVLVDGGFRRGTDIFKALAMGAAAVGIGRPYLYGLATFGRDGVARVVELLRAELAADMGMAGVAEIAQIDRSFVRVRR